MANQNENSLQTAARLAWDAVVISNTLAGLSGAMEDFKKTWGPTPVENVDEIVESNQMALADLEGALEDLAETSTGTK